MKKWGKRIGLLCALGCLALSACGTRQDAAQAAGQTGEEEEEVTMELTDRQKEILKEKGLPETYSELTDGQKSAITGIGEMLAYLEEKYGKTFCYLAYTPSGSGSDETLAAYAADDDLQTEVTVSRVYEDGTFTYTDDYENILLADEYQEALGAHLDEALGGARYQIFVKINAVDGEGETVFEKANATSYLMIDGASFDLDAEEAARENLEWLKSRNSAPAALLFVIQDTEDYEMVNRANYMEMLNGGNYTAYLEGILSGTGSVNIYQR